MQHVIFISIIKTNSSSANIHIRLSSTKHYYYHVSIVERDSDGERAKVQDECHNIHLNGCEESRISSHSIFYFPSIVEEEFLGLSSFWLLLLVLN
jgi:hypothetical protein